jgi:hypothetical protein
MELLEGQSLKERLAQGLLPQDELVELAIESLDLKTGRTSVLLSDPRAGTSGSFCWARDGRIIYARLEGPPNEKDSNLWDIRVDPRTAQVRGQPAASPTGAGFSSAPSPSATTASACSPSAWATEATYTWRNSGVTAPGSPPAG